MVPFIVGRNTKSHRAVRCTGNQVGQYAVALAPRHESGFQWARLFGGVIIDRKRQLIRLVQS